MSGQISDSQSVSHKTNKLLILTAFLIVVIAAIPLVAWFISLGQVHPVSTPFPITVVKGNITINSGSYVYYNFTLSTHVNPSVEGTFTVSGSDQKIRVYVMDCANFVDWQYARKASMYYDSGESSNGNVEANLPLGNYYLVYDNTFSATSKNVTTEVSYLVL